MQTYTYTFGGSFTANLTITDNDYRLTILPESSDPVVDMPDEYSKTVRPPWAAFEKNITSVMIGSWDPSYSKEITNISSYLFYNCTALKTVVIRNLGSGYQQDYGTIGVSCFEGCSALETFVIQNDSHWFGGINSNAFKGCSNLQKVYIEFESLVDYYENVTNLWATLSFENTYSNPLAPGASLYINNRLCENIYLDARMINTISDYAFYGAKIKSVQIENPNSFGPESQIYIGEAAFGNCANLTDFESNVKIAKIGEYAFQNCSSLTNFTVENGITEICKEAFIACKALSKVDYSDSDNSDALQSWCCVKFADITASPLYNNDAKLYFNGEPLVGELNLDTLEYIYDLTELAPALFAKCDQITSVTNIPKNITKLNDSVFYDCSNLASIIIPETVTEIGPNAFGNCSSLTQISLPNKLQSIGSYAFEMCSSLKQITIPDTITTLAGTFRGCTALQSVKLPDNNQFSEIGTYTFAECPNLTQIDIPSSVKDIGDYAFSEAVNLSHIQFGNNLNSIGYEAFYGCSSLTEITIPSNTTYIGYQAFSGCSSLQTLNLQITNVTDSTFGFGVFSGCPLVNLTICSEALSYSSNLNIDPGFIQNVVLIKGSNDYIDSYLFAYDVYPSLESIKISDGFTEIGAYAFYYCTKLTNVEITDSVTTINKGAFSDCTALTTINLPKKLSSIANYTFEYSGLTEIVVPDSVTSIGNDAFRNCAKLESVTIPNSVTSIGSSAFENCDSLTGVTIPNSVETIGDGAFYHCDYLTSVIMSDKVTSIGAGMFSDCTALTSITIPDSVTTIGDYAFNGCSLLTSIEIPNSVISIGSWAFSSCYSLASIVIPDSVTTIGDYAFDNCTQLYDISVSTNLTYLGDDVFRYTTLNTTIFNNLAYIGNSNNPYLILMNIAENNEDIHEYRVADTTKFIYDNAFSTQTVSVTNVYLPDGLLQIGSHAFDRSAIEELILPNSIHTIKGFALANCQNLTTLILSDGLEYLDASFISGSEAIIYNEYDGGLYISSLANPRLYLKGVSSSATTFVLTDLANGPSCFSSTTPLKDGGNLINLTIEGKWNISTSLLSGCPNIESLTISSPEVTFSAACLQACTNIKSLTLPFLGVSLNNSKDLSYLFTTRTPSNSSTLGAIGTNYSYVPHSLSVVILTHATSLSKTAFANLNRDSMLQCIYLPSTLVLTEANAKSTFINYYIKPVIYCGYPEKPETWPTGWNVYRNNNKLDTYWGRDKLYYTPTYLFEQVNDEIIIAKYFSTDADIIELPESFLDMPVTGLQDKLFSGHAEVTQVILPATLKTIGKYAFEKTNITTISLPQSVTTLGSYCFKETQLETIDISDAVTVLPDGLFYNCTQLRVFQIPVQITEIGYSCFAGTSLTDIYLASTLQTVGYRIFDESSVKRIYCQPESRPEGWAETFAYDFINSATPREGTAIVWGSLNNSLQENDFIIHETTSGYVICGYTGQQSEVVVPKKLANGSSITTITNSVFANNSYIKKVTLPYLTDTIPNYLFYKCSALESVEFEESAHIISLGQEVFYGCSKLVNFDCPSNLQSIGKRCFSKCSALRELHIPKTVTSIGYSCLVGCKSLVSLTIPYLPFNNTNQSFFGELFNCNYNYYPDNLPTNLVLLTINTGKITDRGFALFFKNNTPQIVQILDEVSDISNSAFSNQSVGINGLSFTPLIYLPKAKQDTWTPILQDLNIDCIWDHGLVSIDFDTELAWEAVGDNKANVIRVLNTDCTEVILDKVAGNDIIGLYTTFKNCISLTKIQLPESLLSIGSQTFINCTKLQDIVIPDSVVSIGFGAFENCTSFTTIEIPREVTEIADMAFAFCYNVQIINFNAKTVTKSTSTAFRGVGRHVPTGVTLTIGSQVIEVPGSLFHQEQDHTGSSSLYGHNIRSIVFAENSQCVKIGPRAFEGCSLITSLALPDSVTEIEHNAFNGCTLLTTVTIGNSVTTIGISAFSGCTNLTSIVIPDSVTSIGGSAFSHCSKLTSITIPNRVTTIGYACLSDCSSLAFLSTPFREEKQRFIWHLFGASKTADAREFLPATLSLVEVSAGKICELAFENCCLPADDDSQPYLLGIQIAKNVEVEANIFGSTPIENSPTIVYCEATEQEATVWPSDWNAAGCQVCFDCKGVGCTNTGLLWHKISDGTQVSIVDLIKQDENIISLEVPSEIAGVPVTAIADFAFYQAPSLQELTLPETLRVVGNKAISECPELQTVTFNSAGYPNTLWYSLELGDAAFADNLQLITIDLPQHLSKIQAEAFKNCSNITTVYFPWCLAYIDTDAFLGCSSLKSVIIDDLSYWCDITFKNRDANPLANSTPDSPVLLYYKNSEDELVQIADIDLTDRKSALYPYAFYNYLGCDRLTLSAEVMTGLVAELNSEIGITSLCGVSPRELSVAIPTDFNSSLVAILSNNLETAQSLEVKSGSVCAGVLDNLNYPSLQVIFKPDSILGLDSFSDPNITVQTIIVEQPIGQDGELQERADGIIDINNILYKKLADDDTLGLVLIKDKFITEVTLESKISAIGSSAFANCAIEHISLPSTITTIYPKAFYNCKRLKSLNMFNTSIIVEDTVKDLLYNCTSLVELVLPSTENTLSFKEVFGGETVPASLKTLIVSATTIPDKYFENCTSLEAVYLTTQISTIGESIFYESSFTPNSDGTGEQVIKVMYPKPAEGFSPVPGWSEDWLDGCSISGTDDDCVQWGVSIPYNTQEFNYTINLATNEATILSISPFYDDFYTENAISILETVTYGDAMVNITAISDYVFAGCSNIVSVTLPNTIKSIGSNAFNTCRKLQTVTINSGSISFGVNAFAGCRNLAQVNYNHSDYWHKHSFANTLANPLAVCPSGCALYIYKDNDYIKLESLDISDSDISQYAYYGCSSLANVTLSRTTGESYIIAQGAFAYARNLTNLSVAAEYAYKAEVPGEHYIDPLKSVRLKTFKGPTQILNVITDKTKLNSITLIGGEENLRDDLFRLFDNSDTTFVNEAAVLKYLSISPELESKIGNAFTKCSKLINLEAPLSVAITIPLTSTLQSYIENTNECLALPDGLFENCLNLATFVCQDIESIGNSTFKNCINLKNLCIRNAVSALVSIGQDALTGVPTYKSESGHTYIGYQYIASTPVLNTKENYLVLITLASANGKIVLPETTKVIYQKAAANNGVNCIIGTNVVNIGPGAFKNCTNLSAVDFSKIQYIQEEAFANCISLDLKTFDLSSFIEAASNSFAGITCKDTNSYNINKTYDDYTVSYFGLGNSNDNIKILLKVQAVTTNSDGEEIPYTEPIVLDAPTTIQVVGQDAYHGLVFESVSLTAATIAASLFADQHNLTTVDIADTVKHFESDVFKNCYNLTTIKYDGSRIDWCKIKFDNKYSNPLYYTHNYKKQFKPNKGYVEKVVNDALSLEGITDIPDCAFYDLSGTDKEPLFTQFTDVDQVETIGEFAFYKAAVGDEGGNKQGLSIVDLSESTKLKFIGNSAFSSCSGLHTLKLPIVDKLIIEDFAFYDDGITNLTINIPNIVLGYYVFNRLSAIDIENASVNTKLLSQLDLSSVKNLCIFEDGTELSPDCFSGFNKLTSLTFDKYLASEAFLSDQIGYVLSKCPILDEVIFNAGSQYSLQQYIIIDSQIINLETQTVLFATNAEVENAIAINIKDAYATSIAAFALSIPGNRGVPVNLNIPKNIVLINKDIFTKPD